MEPDTGKVLMVSYEARGTVGIPQVRDISVVCPSTYPDELPSGARSF